MVGSQHLKSVVVLKNCGVEYVPERILFFGLLEGLTCGPCI